MSEVLVRNLSSLLQRSITQARTPEAQQRLEDAQQRLLGPLRLAIAGRVKAGKSTMLNALVGEGVAPTDEGECTKIPTWYQWGNSPQVMVQPLSGSPIMRPWKRSRGALEVDLGTLTAGEVDQIDVSWPTSRLRELTILDTPGIASIRTEISNRTLRVLTADDGRLPIADAVLYLMRHTHASDVQFLEAFQTDDLAQGTPLNSIGVLSRADEIGSCRLDAMAVASRIADRYQHDPRIRRLCTFVLPVNGLLAYASVTLREAEFAMLAAIAGGSEQATEELLLTADRFVDPRRSTELGEGERSLLLDRFGLFGVRVSVDMIRTGAVSTASELAQRLADLSGLDRLRSVVLEQFERRSKILKARSALAMLNEVLRSGGCRDAGQLLGAVEELTSKTQDFEELGLLVSLRSGQVELRPDQTTELDRLLGGSGHDVLSRLGLPADADVSQVRETALRTLAAWQQVAEHPLSNRTAQMAARVAMRTLEGIVAASTENSRA
jgi:Dynamin family